MILRAFSSSVCLYPRRITLAGNVHASPESDEGRRKLELHENEQDAPRYVDKNLTNSMVSSEKF